MNFNDLFNPAEFSARHISFADQPALLAALGEQDMPAFIDGTVPQSIRMPSELDLPDALSEADALAKLKGMAAKNRINKSYIGLGYYPTRLPYVIQRNVLENPGWYTAYTPYQAEIAQGRLEALLGAHPERDPALSRVAPQGALTLRDVVAVAPGRAEPILKGVSVAVPQGTVTVVLGPSGSGKSTLARCMLGIWPDVSGEVLLDGLPIAGWDRNELGPYVGYLPQDVELFEGSIAENIARFGEVSPEKVIAAARSAGLHEMILRFPKGYDTPIGEAGHLLSGGQRQRIGLARAMYGDPVLVVLDEPNANLDDVGEAALVRAVQELKVKGCTVFLITHRPGIVAVADRVLVLRNGVVKADGPRDEVLAALRTAQSVPEGSGALRPQAA